MDWLHSLKSNFYFPAEVLGIWVAHEEEGKGMRVRRDIECLSLADARKWAGGYIANDISTGFTRSDTHRSQPTHQIRRIVDMEVVKLDVLPCRDVGDAIGVFFR